MLTGVGAVAKGISTANKARKVFNAADKAARIARTNVWKMAPKVKRETDAVQSLTLMGAPTKTIMKRQVSANAARSAYNQALAKDTEAMNNLLQASKNLVTPNISNYTPLIYTNPGFHAAGKAIKN